MSYILIRESRTQDLPFIAELVRKSYTSNVSSMFLAALFNEVTFQAIILVAAFMFIFMGVPLLYCLGAVPFVLVMLYILIYGSVLMKSAELMYSKKALQCFVAEAYEQPFCTENPQTVQYRIVQNDENIDVARYRKKIVGTCSVMKHNLSEDWAWLFRLAVDSKYRRRGLGLALTQKVQNWCKSNKYDYLELVITECQDDARQVFANAGFQVRQLYHKRLFTSAFTIQMLQLRSEIRSTFK